jgi:purine-nucleoside phosphorylase
VPADGATRTYLHGDPFAPAADFDLTRALVDTARSQGLQPTIGVVQSVDVFYNPDTDYAGKMRSRNVVAVEMEAAALFYLAMRERGRGNDVEGACILTVSDTLVKDDESYGTDYMALEDLEAATTRMIRIALEAGTSLGR